MSRRVGSVGEEGLLRLIAGWMGRPHPKVARGIGDDCATVRATSRTLFTVDAFVEGVHFRRAWGRPWEAGWKALAANVSDIAAGGGIPRAAVVSLELPPTLPLGWLREFYAGLAACARTFDVGVAGGNLARGRRVACHIAVTGDAPRRPVGRTGARPGDLVAVTGALGGSLAGLRCLQKGWRGGPAAAAIHRHLFPVPRVAAGRALAPLASAMVDVSDGLAHEAELIARASSVALVVVPGAVPVHPAAWALAPALRCDPAGLALSSGEEYELLFTVPRRRWGRARGAVGKAGLALAPIGEVRRGRGVELAGRRRPVPGFDHFARAR